MGIQRCGEERVRAGRNILYVLLNTILEPLRSLASHHRAGCEPELLNHWHVSLRPEIEAPAALDFICSFSVLSPVPKLTIQLGCARGLRLKLLLTQEPLYPFSTLKSDSPTQLNPVSLRSICAWDVCRGNRQGLTFSNGEPLWTAGEGSRIASFQVRLCRWLFTLITHPRHKNSCPRPKGYDTRPQNQIHQILRSLIRLRSR